MKSEIGILYGRKPYPETMLPFLPIYEYAVTQPSRESARTTWFRFRWSEPVQFFGVQLVLEKAVELGKKQGWKLILRIPIRSFGADTSVRDTLSSMNFEEESISVTCYDGWIGTRSEWKLKDPVSHLGLTNIGSLAISTQENGIQK